MAAWLEFFCTSILAIIKAFWTFRVMLLSLLTAGLKRKIWQGNLINEHFERADNMKWKEALLCVMKSAFQFHAFAVWLMVPDTGMNLKKLYSAAHAFSPHLG